MQYASVILEWFSVSKLFCKKYFEHVELKATAKLYAIWHIKTASVVFFGIWIYEYS